MATKASCASDCLPGSGGCYSPNVDMSRRCLFCGAAPGVMAACVAVVEVTVRLPVSPLGHAFNGGLLAG